MRAVAPAGRGGVGEDGVIHPLRTRADEVRALAELRSQVRRQGLDRATPGLALAILIFHVTAMLGALAIVLTADTLWLRALALLVSTYGALGVGIAGHNASHNALTGRVGTDRALTYLAMTVLCGMSATYWRQKHIQLHHAGPNNVGVDSDIELAPYFVLSQDEMARASGWQQRVYSVQHWIFPFALGLVVINLQVHGVRHLIRTLRGSGRRALPEWADVGCLCLHAGAFLVVPALYWPAWQALGLVLLREVLSGYAMFASAAPAHFPGEARFVRAEPDGRGLLACQTHTTVNFRTGFWGRLVCQGSQYQIEHHLLPNANPYKLQDVSGMVEAFCRRHGYPYRSFGWSEGIVKSFCALKHPKHVYTLSELATLNE